MLAFGIGPPQPEARRSRDASSSRSPRPGTLAMPSTLERPPRGRSAPTSHASPGGTSGSEAPSDCNRNLNGDFRAVEQHAPAPYASPRGACPQE
eukprot:3378560-Alexandrium_andersonii.AAC.1